MDSPTPVLTGLPPSPALRRLLAHRYGGIVLFAALFLLVAAVTRAALVLRLGADRPDAAGTLAAFAWGALYDLGAAGFAALPGLVLLAALPRNWGRRAWQRVATHAGLGLVLFALGFGAVAEWTFWDEFGVRFNFIAVDYLVYTTEVLGNIRESYNLPAIVAGVAAASLLGVGLLVASGAVRLWLDHAEAPAGRRWLHGATWAAGAIVLGTALTEEALPAFANNYQRELAKNGLWSLVAAFRANALDYDRFYATLPVDAAFSRLHEELESDGSRLVRPADRDTLRLVRHPGVELRPNVVQITVESLSADFVGTFNHASHLTPRLEEYARRSLVFENFYATGTRTDRGMEALTLSLPPTPGRSMVKRPHNEDMFTLGSVFRAKGYDTAFLYGGYGYFDNMSHFFGSNGYRVVDRAAVGRDDITFANAWGACDEDLYRWTMREADAAHASGRPFHFFVMTTSNHRPFTFPEGRIDLPSKVSGRAGAVKYSDYAIGRFLDEASKKPWYKDTVFVIVADHCASSAGRTEIPIENYHIPLMVFAPGGQIAPGRIRTLTSQMDYAPTLLGLLNWSYPSRFFGHDVLHEQDTLAHALIGTYQRLGHLEDGHLVVLKPQRVIADYQVDLANHEMRPAAADAAAQQEAICYYQSAHYLYVNHAYRSVPADQAAALAAAAPVSGSAGSE